MLKCVKLPFTVAQLAACHCLFNHVQLITAFNVSQVYSTCHKWLWWTINLFYISIYNNNEVGERWIATRFEWNGETNIINQKHLDRLLTPENICSTGWSFGAPWWLNRIMLLNKSIFTLSIENSRYHSKYLHKVVIYFF